MSRQPERSTYADVAHHVEQAQTASTEEQLHHANDERAAWATEELRHVAAARRYLDELTTAAVRSARIDGASWAQIGTGLGITKQAAQQRYGKA